MESEPENGIRILLVEDNADDAALIREYAEASPELRRPISRVGRLRDALHVLQAEPVQVVLLDLSLPDSDGLETVRRMVAAAPDQPVIVLTGTDDDRLAREAIHVGAQDYLPKSSLDSAALLRSIRYAVERHATQRRIRTLSRGIEQSASIVIVTDAKGLIQYANPSFTRISGYTCEEALGRSPSMLKSGQHPDSFYAGLWNTILSGMTWRGEICNRSKDHGTYWVSATISPIRNASGAIVNFVCVQEDITKRREVEEERRRTQEALEASERMLKLVMATLPGGVVHVSVAGDLVLANRVAHGLLGKIGVFHGTRLISLGGMPLPEIVGPGKVGVAQQIRVSEPQPRVYTLRANRTGSHPQDGFVLLVEDVTEQVEIDRKIQDQYRLATVGQLAAGIAHDFNNMLTVIMGSAQLMSMAHGLRDDMREDLDVIVKQGQRAAELVSQVLDFSRQSTSDLRAADVAPFLKELGKLLQRLLPENIRVRVDVANRPCTVRVNLTKLQQMITNLAVNGRDAMPDGGELRFTARVVTVAEEGEPPPVPGMEAGDWLVCSVADTGTGIPPQIVHRIFDPFFTTKQPGAGTGLGLAQAYGIARQFGGHIRLDNRPGEGVRFDVYLPLVQAADEASRHQDIAIPKGNGEVILVAEDDAGVRRSICEMLKLIGYSVMEACDGSEALLLLEENRPRISLLLTDIVMPGMSGPALIRSAVETCKDLPVVIVSGYQIEHDDALEKLPVSARLGKPVSLHELAKAVHTALL